MVLLLVSLAVSCQAGSRYYSKPPPPIIVQRVAPSVVVHQAPLPIIPAPLPIRTEVPVAVPLAAAPVPIITTATSSQFHSQDELGQAAFGFSNPDQMQTHRRDANGNMVGSWSFVNPEGKIVQTSYIADALGFRVVSNDLPVAPLAAGPAPLPILPAPLPLAPASIALPVGPAPVLLDTPEVMEARRQHALAHAEAKARNGLLIRNRRGAGYGRSYPKKTYHKEPAPVFFRHEVPAILPPPTVVVEAVPVAQPLTVLPHSLPAVHALPAIHPAPLLAVPAGPTVSRFHSQDELGQAAFGFTTPDQSQSNFRDIHGNQVGHYSYINPDGQEIVVHYSAGRDGFRVLSNALPVAPLAAAPAGVVFQDAPALPIAVAPVGPVALPIGPAPVLLDTPEVEEAKRQHFAAHAEAVLRNQRLL